MRREMGPLAATVAMTVALAGLCVFYGVACTESRLVKPGDAASLSVTSLGDERTKRGGQADIADAESTGTTGAGGELDQETARKALLVMAETLPRGRPDKKALDSLKDDPAKRLEDGRTAFGPWEIDIERRTFRFQVIAPPYYHLLRGVFTKDENGVWRATPTKMAMS